MGKFSAGSWLEVRYTVAIPLAICQAWYKRSCVRVINSKQDRQDRCQTRSPRLLGDNTNGVLDWFNERIKITRDGEELESPSGILLSVGAYSSCSTRLVWHD